MTFDEWAASEGGRLLLALEGPCPRGWFEALIRREQRRAFEAAKSDKHKPNRWGVQWNGVTALFLSERAARAYCVETGCEYDAIEALYVEVVDDQA